MNMRDLRHSVRALIKQPLFSAIVILTLALGIGANTAIFSVVNAVLLRPLPFPRPQQLVVLALYDLKIGPKDLDDRSACSYPDFVDWRDQNRVFATMAVHTHQGMTLTDGKEAAHIQGGVGSADLFRVLGVQPALGRDFLPNEDQPGSRVVILSYELWQRRFASDPGMIGKSIVLDGEQYQVIGVMPSHFSFPMGPFAPELWVPISILRESRDGSKPMTEERGNDFLQSIARLKAGVSVEQAQANMNAIGAALRLQYPDSNTDVAIKVLPLVSAMVANAHSALLMLAGMAACVLLVACVNVANLLLARAVSRQREVSIRTALGAGRWQIIRQLITESAVLGLCGGFAGLLFAVWGLDALKAFLPADISRITKISPDLRVLAFTAAVSLAVGLLCGLMPAWRASHPNLAASLNEMARGSTEATTGRRMRAALVVVEVVLALLLLSSAGLLVESFLRLQQVQPGFDPRNVMTARIALPSSSYPKAEQSIAFYKNLLAGITNLPGVESVSAAWWIPLSGSEIMFNFDIEERPLPKGQQPIAHVNVVADQFFAAMHVPLLRGREFTARDDHKATAVAVVSESFAKQFFRGEDPVGKRIRPNGSAEPGDPPMREIIGVVADIHLISLGSAPKPQIYIPHQQFPIESMAIFVRTATNPEVLGNTLRQAIGQIDKDVPLYRARPLADYIAQSVAQPRLNAMLVGFFAFIALLLAAAGIFGVMSYSVTQRTQEIGIRLALGAQRSDVLRLIVSQGMQLVVIGIAAGCVGVFALARLLRGLLFGIGATDVPTLLGVSIALTGVALLACLFPGMRAARLNPVIALRAE
jgi:predicted permease